jgi:hypothetical protein
MQVTKASIIEEFVELEMLIERMSKKRCYENRKLNDEMLFSYILSITGT